VAVVNAQAAGLLLSLLKKKVNKEFKKEESASRPGGRFPAFPSPARLENPNSPST
tara:strand:- start:4480 stop:4644 length:165 start_codon:yes stop_codon:yes gene_type:complete